MYGQVCRCDCDCGSCLHLLLLKHVLIVLLFGVVTKDNISRHKTQGVFLPVNPQPGNTRGLQCSSRFPIVVPVRLGFFCPGLERPDISNRFRCDPTLDRKQAGGARFLGPPHFEDVDGLFWGQPDLAMHSRRLKLKVFDKTMWREAWSTQ